MNSPSVKTTWMVPIPAPPPRLTRPSRNPLPIPASIWFQCATAACTNGTRASFAGPSMTTAGRTRQGAPAIWAWAKSGSMSAASNRKCSRRKAGQSLFLSCEVGPAERVERKLSFKYFVRDRDSRDIRWRSPFSPVGSIVDSGADQVAAERHASPAIDAVDRWIEIGEIRRVVQADVKIFELGRPIPVDRIFNAGAGRPAWANLGLGEGVAILLVGDGFHIGPGHAAGDIGEPAISGHGAEAHARGAEPVLPRLAAACRVESGRQIRCAAIGVRPGHVALQAE